MWNNIKSGFVAIGLWAIFMAGLVILPIKCNEILKKKGISMFDEGEHYDPDDDPFNEERSDTLFYRDSIYIVTTRVDTVYAAPKKRE